MVAVNWIPIIVGAIFGAIITYIFTLIINALTREYPMTNLDYWMRKHIKAGKIRGENLVIYRGIELRGFDSLSDFFSRILNSSVNGSAMISNEILKNCTAKISMTNKVGLSVSSLLSAGKVNGIFKIEGSPDFDQIGEDESFPLMVTISITIESWKLSAVKDILFDSNTFLSDFLNSVKDEMGVSLADTPNTLSFKLKKTPAGIGYLSRANISYIHSDIDGTKFSLTKDHCSFEGVKTSTQFNKVIDTMVWFV